MPKCDFNKVAKQYLLVDNFWPVSPKSYFFIKDYVLGCLSTQFFDSLNIF